MATFNLEGLVKKQPEARVRYNGKWYSRDIARKRVASYFERACEAEQEGNRVLATRLLFMATRWEDVLK